MRRIALSMAVATGFFCPAAFAATVQDISGPVLANEGVGFKRVAGTRPVAPGTRLIANPGGSATIVYDNGCIERVEPGVVVTVKPAGACEAPSATPYILGAVVVGAGVALAIGGKDDKKPASP